MDLIRIDHFRGFEAYWEVEGKAKTAKHGRWVQAPGTAFFNALRQRFVDLPLIAEDLGLITPEVEAFAIEFGLPGMRVLQFGLSPAPRMRSIFRTASRPIAWFTRERTTTTRRAAG